MKIIKPIKDFYKGIKMAFRVYKKDNVMVSVRYCDICKNMTPHYTQVEGSRIYIKCSSCENILKYIFVEKIE